MDLSWVQSKLVRGTDSSTRKVIRMTRPEAVMGLWERDREESLALIAKRVYHV